MTNWDDIEYQACPKCGESVDVAAEACACGQKIRWGRFGLTDPERPLCEQYVSCPGLFVDGEQLNVTRCDSCQRFESDLDAAACADALIDLLRRVGHQMYRRAGREQKESMTVADVMDELVRRAHVEDEPEDLHVFEPRRAS